MRNITRASLAVLGSAALLGSMALPASAVDVLEDTNDATVEIQAGFLVLDTTGATLTLSHSGASELASTATGTLTGVNVSDLNSDGLGWTSTATLTNLTDAVSTEDIDVSGAVFESTVTAQTGTTVTGGTNTVTAADGGNNAATWNTTITINVPNTTKGGTYTGTLTHSLV